MTAHGGVPVTERPAGRRFRFVGKGIATVEDVITDRPQLIAIGGFPGSGKSTVAGALATGLRIPVLDSDLVGNTIRGVLDEHHSDPIAGSVAFRAGYTVLFALAEETVMHRCSVIIDASLGWAFQWDALDAIIARHPTVGLRPIILDCSSQTCTRRLQARHHQDPKRYPPAEQFMSQPQLAGVRALLDALDRPDLARIDAEQPATRVYDHVRTCVTAHADRDP